MGDDPRDAPDGAVEREFAQYDEAVEPSGGNSGLFGDDRKRDGEIERRAGFPDARRREVDGDPFLRERVAGILDGAPDAVAALLDGGVAESDDGERGESRGDVGFDRNGNGSNAPEGRREGF